MFPDLNIGKKCLLPNEKYPNKKGMFSQKGFLPLHPYYGFPYTYSPKIPDWTSDQSVISVNFK